MVVMDVIHGYVPASLNPYKVTTEAKSSDLNKKDPNSVPM